MVEAQVFVDERRQLDWPTHLLDNGRHTSLEHARVLRLFEANEVFEQVREFLERKSILQTFGHQRDFAGCLFYNLGAIDALCFAIGSHQLNSRVSSLFKNASV